MCGIAGYVAFGDRIAPDEVVKEMSERLKSRGPDSSGFYLSEDRRVCFAHRRLAIIDLEDRASQPMQTPDGNYVLVFNGEIYNYLELKEDLKQRGHTFSTTSDTEVLLYAFKEWGNKCVHKLRGMFAFVLFDKKNHCVILARDRFGIKPLYVVLDSTYFAFASNADALREALGLRKLNRQAIALYLRYKFVPTPRAIWERMEKVPPGELWEIEIHNGHCSKSRYWSLVEVAGQFCSTRKPRSCSDLIARIRESVALHMRSDVKVGVLLSGGLDSGTVTALIRQTYPDSQLLAFTLHFGNIRNEVPLARSVAKKFHVRHFEHELPEESLQDTLDILARIYGEPLADSSAVPYYHLSEFVSRYVKVALGGDGGDELFFGYKWYMAWNMLSLLPSIPISANSLQHIASYLDKRLGVALVALSNKGQERLEWLHGYELSAKEIALATGRHGPELLSGYDDNLPDDIRLRVYDWTTFTMDAILHKVDAASMAHGLEVRVPFLDHILLEHVLGLPKADLSRGMQGKIAIRRCMKSCLPAETIAGVKTGFGAPLKDWSSTLIQMAETLLPNGRAVESGIISGTWLKKLLTNRTWRKESKLWTFIILENWLKIRENWE